MAISQYLRRLRALDRDWQAAAHHLRSVRAIANPGTDLTELEAVESEARTRFDMLASEHPALAAEYSTRAELAETLATVQRLARLLDTQRPPAALDPRHAERAATLRKAIGGLVAAASAADADYQLACATDESWERIAHLDGVCARAGRRVREAEAKLAKATAKIDAHAAATRRHAADAAMLTAELDAARARAAELRATLPATVNAPLTEPRPRGYGAPVSAETAAAIRERYLYDPHTDSLHRATTGELVHAPQSVRINGERVPRAQVIAILSPGHALA